MKNCKKFIYEMDIYLVDYSVIFEINEKDWLFETFIFRNFSGGVRIVEKFTSLNVN